MTLVPQPCALPLKDVSPDAPIEQNQLTIAGKRRPKPALQDAVGTIMTDGTDAILLYASFSAADWIAPFARTGRAYFYADERGLSRLQADLGLQSAAKGANIDILVPDDPAVLGTAVPLNNGLLVTNAVQTYLDLSIAGERDGNAGINHLRNSGYSLLGHNDRVGTMDNPDTSLRQ